MENISNETINLVNKAILKVKKIEKDEWMEFVELREDKNCWVAIIFQKDNTKIWYWLDEKLFVKRIL